MVLPGSHNDEHFTLWLPPALPPVARIPRLPPPQVRLGAVSFPFPSHLRLWHCRRAKLLPDSHWVCTTWAQGPIQSAWQECCQVLEQLNRDGDFGGLGPAAHTSASCLLAICPPPSADLETFSKARTPQLRLRISSFLRQHRRKASAACLKQQRSPGLSPAQAQGWRQ